MPTTNSNLPLIEPGDPIQLVTDFNALATAVDSALAQKANASEMSDYSQKASAALAKATEVEKK